MLNSFHATRARRCLWMMALAFPVLAGCGDEAKTTTVRGKITYQNKPVTYGLINFQPAQGKLVGGSINSDGTYEFEIPAGEYKVRIDAPTPMPPGFKEGDPMPKPGPRPVPEKFADFGTSDLTATIKDESPQKLDFPLE